MITNKIFDLYLPKGVAYHVKLLIGSALTSLIFMLIMAGEFRKSMFLPMFPMVFVQFEIFIWLGKRFFNFFPVSENRKAGIIIRGTIIRLLFFYLIVMLIAFLIIIISIFIQAIIQNTSTGNLFTYFFQHESRGFLTGAGTGLLFGTLVFFYFMWQDSLRRELKLNEEKLIFQYETLKNQVNPHFLFNSLNTLSSLIGPDQEKARAYISKLSSIYRYILEKKDSDMTGLQDEIQFVKDYFYLQSTRDEGKIFIEIDIPFPEKYMILPISLQISLENAFKHNAATREKPLVVKIRFEEPDRISISNLKSKKTTLETSPGLGLRNLGERIRLTTGRELEIINTDELFTLKIPLKKII